jgi:hypothetical protein
VAGALRDTELPKRWNDVKTKQNIYGGEPEQLVPGELMSSPGRGKALVKSLPVWATTLPLDTVRLGKIVSNSKFARVLEAAYLRGGPKVVAMDWFLLQQTDPEASAIASEPSN